MVPFSVSESRLYLFISVAIFLCSYTVVRIDFPAPPKIDLFVKELFLSFHDASFTDVVVYVTTVGNMRNGFLFASFLLLYFFWKKRHKEGTFLFLSINGAILLHALLKHLVQRPRPDTQLVSLHSYSFPSGHATLSAAIALSLYIAFASELSQPKRNLFVLFLVIWPLLISFTRLYLSVHYFCDVVAGMALGVAWTLSLYLLLNPAFNTPQKD